MYKTPSYFLTLTTNNRIKTSLQGQFISAPKYKLLKYESNKISIFSLQNNQTLMKADLR